jgi:hypothetical protein
VVHILPHLSSRGKYLSHRRSRPTGGFNRALLPMTRYYFDLRDGEIFIEDAEGLDLLNIAETQIESRNFSGT